MDIKEEKHNGVLVLQISDQIDSTTGPVLGKRLEKAIEEDNKHLVIDLTDVPYISSAGLRVLSIALKAIRAHYPSGDLCLANLSSTVAHAFRISGFNQVFRIYDTVPQAVAELSGHSQLDPDR